MKKVLYVDIPFAGINDGGANRSKFIWQTLIAHYEVDWLQLQRPGIPVAPHLPSGLNNHFILSTDVDRRFWRPVIIYRFAPSALKEFENILQKGHYDLIFFRFLSPAQLAKSARKFTKSLVFDVDMVLSRLSRLSWLQNPVFNNRYYWQESKKQEAFEKKFFKQPWLFLFTNFQEKNQISARFKNKQNFQVLPNVMKEQMLHKLPKKNRILFFGTLTSAANADALHYISSQLYPQMAAELKKRDLFLDVIGRGWNDNFKKYFAGKDRLRYIGEVDDIQKEIAQSILVFLPLRIASGTRTRILEAANQAVAVLTTPIGLEGLDFAPSEVAVKSEPEYLTKELFAMLSNHDKIEKMGEQLFLKSRALYLEDNVSDQLINLLEKEMN